MAEEAVTTRGAEQNIRVGNHAAGAPWLEFGGGFKQGVV
jgi:hypothetical protein